MKEIRNWLGAVIVFTFAGALPISAADFTGNPVTDGWKLQGNSLTLGTYIRGDAGLSFDVYSHFFTIATNFGPWQAGDELLGLGGVNNSGFIFEPRLVAKFGAAGATFSASSLASPNGNGNGSFSTGDAGNGGIQVAFWYLFSGNILSSSADNGGVEYPDISTNPQDFVLRYNGVSSTISSNFGATLALFQRISGKDVLKTWEAVVDITALGDPSRGNFGIQIPIPDGLADMALQETVSGAPANFTDGLIPEPSTYSLVFVSVAVFGWMVRRRYAVRI